MAHGIPATLDPGLEATLVRQLHQRKTELEQAIRAVPDAAEMIRVLQQVDRVLDRVHTPAFGRCAVCNGPMTDDQLLENPAAEYCFCHPNEAQMRHLERDLGLAWKVQSSLLPPPRFAANGLEAHYRYQPFGAVSGDYLDLFPCGGGLCFVIADVSGKGVASAMVMAHLNATIRSLVRASKCTADLVASANRVLRESTLPSHYATLVAGDLRPDGTVEIVNAGHCAPLVARAGGVTEIASGGPPIRLGVMGDPVWETARIRLEPGDTLLLFTDGLTEAEDGDGNEYGVERLAQLLGRHRATPLGELGSEILADLGGFLGGAGRKDDLSLLAIRRTA